MAQEDNTRRMIPVSYATHKALEQVKHKLTVERGGIKTTYDDVVKSLLTKMKEV